jgi:hypothetical protein
VSAEELLKLCHEKVIGEPGANVEPAAGWKREMLGAVPTVAAVTVVVIVFDANAFGSDEIFTQKFAV